MTIEVFIKEPEKVEVLQYDGTNYDEVVKFAGERFHKIKNCFVKGDYIVKYNGTNNIKVTIYKPDFAKQELIGSYTKDVVQGVNPNVHMSLEKLQEYFEVPIVDDRNYDEYNEQQNSNHASKPSDFSLRDLVMKFAQPHIKYYIKRLEEYGFELELINEALISDKEVYLPFIFLKDKNCNDILIVNQKGCYSMSGHRQAFELRIAQKIIKKSADGTIFTNDYVAFEVKDNNWREAFNKLVASFTDEIMKNTNHHAGLTS